MKRLIILFAVVLSFNGVVKAQQQQENSNKANKLQELNMEVEKHFAFSNISKIDIDNQFVLPDPLLECAIPPTQETINLGEWVFTERLYEASQALKLGIPVFNASGSHNLKVYVRDYRRAASCLAKDNKTNLLYGQLIRTVIEIENYDASVGVDLASIAASGTIKHNSQKFYFYKTGFFNPGIDSILGKVSGKPFDVESYHDYQNVMSAVIALLQLPGTTFKATKFGLADLPNAINTAEEDFNKAPILSYALTNIAKGNSYIKAIEKFVTNKETIEIINNSYKNLNCPTDDTKPNDIAVAIAKRYLQGLKTN